jgi:hypothetical protein
MAGMSKWAKVKKGGGLPASMRGFVRKLAAKHSAINAGTTDNEGKAFGQGGDEQPRDERGRFAPK